MLTYFVLGDWGRHGTPGQHEVARAMARVARLFPPDAVISTGDNFYDDGVDSVDDPHWELSFERVYADASLAVPWYVALGNHDNNGRPQAQIDYSRISPRWRLPGRYHEAEPAPGVQLVCLDTSVLLPRHWPDGDNPLPGVAGVDAGEQLRWLDAVLAGSAAPWKIVVGHHPIISGSPYHGSSPELEQVLLPLLKRHGVQLYLAGHEHDLQHLLADDLHCVVCGAGAELRETGWLNETLFARSDLGFAVLRLAETHAELRFYDADAALLYRHDIARETGRGRGITPQPRPAPLPATRRFAR